MGIEEKCLFVKGRKRMRKKLQDKMFELTYLFELFISVIVGIAVLILGFIMLTQGWKYTTTLGSRGTYVSMPKVSRFWMYFPIPVAGVAMIIFELEAIYNDIKAFFVKEGEA